MTGIHLGKSKRRVMSWVRREQNIARQRVIAAGCLQSQAWLRSAHLFSFHGGGEEVGGYPNPLTIEQFNCFKMVSPTLGVHLIKVMCVCLRNNQTK